MSRNYDNWERLVAAVIKRQQIWELCHQHSTTPSTCSEASSSDFSSSNYSQASYVMLENNKESAQKPVPKFVLTEGSLTARQRLGKGGFGPPVLIQARLWISDHDFLAEGTQLVLKKFVSEFKVTEEEFKMVFENCRHENVSAPRAYYFSDNGNYIFNDYHGWGSVYDLLHVKSTNGRPNWESRLKIAIGVARGIAHIQAQYGGKLAHGNVNSSVIFLNSKQYGRVSDFGFSSIIKSPGKQVAAIYLAAEYEHVYKIKNASHESDVCDFGVVLLELLTGKSPMEPLPGFRRNVHIVEWALSMRPEEWSSKLFDRILWSSELSYQSLSGIFCDEVDMFNFERGLELKRKIKAEMVEMLQLARRCLVIVPEDRPKMFEVVLMLENIASFGNIPKPPTE